MKSARSMKGKGDSLGCVPLRIIKSADAVIRRRIIENKPRTAGSNGTKRFIIKLTLP